MELKLRNSIFLINFPFNVLIEPLWNWNYLTLNINYNRLNVLIEPLWNWNVAESHHRMILSCINRTFMELKFGGAIDNYISMKY